MAELLRYRSTAPTANNGEQIEHQADANGNAKVTLATTIAGEDIATDVLKVEQRFTYLNITTQTTTTVKSGSGFFHSLIINTPVASSVITMYDNTAASGTKIGTITLPATLLSDGPKQAIFDVTFTTGLTVVTGTASSDITVAYR